MDAPTTRVTISRTSSEDVQQRQVIVTIDSGAPIQLLYGETATLDIAPGAHVFKAHNTLVRKQLPFEVSAGDHVRFEVANRASRWMFGFLVVMGVAPLYLTVERVDSPRQPSA